MYRIDNSLNDAPYQGIHIYKDNKHVITFWEDDAPVREFNALQYARARRLVNYLNTGNDNADPQSIYDAFEHATFIK